jgi:hypothetical protein
MNRHLLPDPSFSEPVSGRFNLRISRKVIAAISLLESPSLSNAQIFLSLGERTGMQH